jgi:hypothetical protein
LRLQMSREWWISRTWPSFQQVESVSVTSLSLCKSLTQWVIKKQKWAGTLLKIYTLPDKPPSSPYRKNWHSNCQRAIEHLKSRNPNFKSRIILIRSDKVLL